MSNRSTSTESAAPERAPSHKPLYGRLFWLVITVGAVVRLAYLFAYLAEVPYAQAPMNDAEIAWTRAESILQEGPLLPGTDPYYQPPLYPYVLALIRAVAGDRPLAAMLFQQLLGLLNMALTWRLAAHLLGKDSAWIPAILTGLAWPVLAYETKLTGATLSTTSILLLLTGLLSQKGPAWQRALLCGGILGLAVLLRPNWLLLVPLVLFWMAWFETDRRTAWQNPALAALAFAAVLLPVTLRNVIIGGDAVLLCANGGVTFYMGNNAHAAGALGQAPDIPTDIRGQARADRIRASELAGESLSASEASAFWYGRAVKWGLTNPNAAAGLLFKKGFLTVTGRAGGVNYDLQNEPKLFRENRWISWMTTGLMGFTSLILGGGWVALCAHAWWRRRTDCLLVLPIAAAWGVSLLFYASVRFWVPVLPLLAILGSYAVLPDRKPHRHTWATTGATVLLAVLFILLPVRWSDAVLAWQQPHYQPSLAEAVTAYNLGVCYERIDNLPLAEERYRFALERDAEHRSAAKNLGALLGRTARYEEAEAVLRKALLAHPGDAEIAYNLAVTAHRLGQLKRALELLDTVLRKEPKYSSAARLRHEIVQGYRKE